MKINLGLSLILVSLSVVNCSQLKRNNAPKTFAIKKLWVRHTLSENFLGFRHPHRMTPIVTKTLVIQGNSIDGISAFHRISGGLKWRLLLKGGVEAGAAVENNQLFFGANDGLFYSINLETGLVNWTFPIRSEGLGAPTVEEGIVYFLAGNNILYALDAKKGQQLWLYNRRDNSSISIRGGSQPSIVGNKLYAGFSDGYLVALDKRNGNLIWEKSLNQNKRFKDVDAQPVIDGDRLFVSSYDGKLFSLNRNDGRTFWENDLGGHTPVTLVGKRLFYSTSFGDVVALDKTSGKQIWAIKTTRGVATQPKEFRGLIVFGESSGDFRVVDARTGNDVGAYSTGRGVMGAPYIDPESGETFFISVNAHLYGFKLVWVSPKEVWPWEK